MKKSAIILIVSFLTVLSFTSCKDAKKCWSINSTLQGETSTKYFWGTEDEAVTEIKRMENEESRKDVTKLEEKSYKTMEDCLANNH